MSPGSTRATAALAGALLLLALCAASDAAETPPPQETSPLARLASAADAMPDDPALQWALARAYAQAERFEEAAAAYADFRARWPERRPDALRAHGDALRGAGRPEQALPLLAEAVAKRPDDALAHLYLGLTQLALGQAEAADASLASAATLAPELAETAALLRGTAALRDGRDRHGEAVLRDLLDTSDFDAPEGGVARRVAGAVLARHTQRERPRIVLFAHGGIEHDSNVTLDAGLDLPGLPTDQADWVGVFGGGISAEAWRGERTQLSLGYRYDRSAHFELSAFDLEGHQAWARAGLQLGSRLWLRVDGRGYTSRLDDDRYLDLWSASPALWITLGDRAGSLRLFGLFEQQSYHDPPILTSLERDGIRYGGGVEHLVSMPVLGDRGWFSWGGRFVRTDTEGERDFFGLGPAFDGDRYELRLRAALPLVFGFRLEASAVGARESYDHRNVVDFLTDDAIGDPTPSRRRDTVFELRTALVRPIGRHVDLEFAVRATYRSSNVDVYDYDRRVAGVYLRVHGP